MGVTDTALAYARLVKGLGGGGGGGGGGELMGFEIMGSQAQDTSPNVGIKNELSTSNRLLKVSLKGRPKTRAQLVPFKRLAAQGIHIKGKHPVSTNKESKIFPDYLLLISLR